MLLNIRSKDPWIGKPSLQALYKDTVKNLEAGDFEIDQKHHIPFPDWPQHQRESLYPGLGEGDKTIQAATLPTPAKLRIEDY